MSETLYIPVAQPVPYTHHAVERFDVPAIERSEISEAQADPPIKIAPCEARGNLREFLPGYGVNLRLKSGLQLHLPHFAIALALEGGGEFIVAAPNPLYDQPITREQFEAEEKEREEDEDGEK